MRALGRMRLIGSLMAVVSLGLLVGTATPALATNPTRVLVAVGANVGLAEESPLSFADKDASRFARLMRRLGNVSESALALVTRPTVDSVLAAIDRAGVLASKHGADEVEFFFYYSGHADNGALHVAGERLPLKVLEARLAAVPARLRVSVIDACRNAPDLSYKGGLSRGPGFAVALEAPTGIRGVLTVRSSADGEASQESQQLGGAVFTHALLTGLRGAADRDRDGQVTFDEAYGWAYRQTVRRTAESNANIMHPSIELDVEGAGSLVLTRVRPRLARLVLPPGTDIRYLVYAQPSGSVVAELWSDREREQSLPLAAGRYLVHRRGSSGAAAMQFTATNRERVVAEHARFHRVPEATLASKGGHLQLRSHNLQLSYGAGVSHAATLAHGGGLRYGYHALTWALSAQVGLGMTDYAHGEFERSERWLGGDLRVELLALLGPIDLALGATWRVVEQVQRRHDAAILARAGYVVDERHVGFSGGPLAALVWRFGLSRAWSLEFELGASLLLRQEGADIAVRPEGVFLVGLGASL